VAHTSLTSCILLGLALAGSVAPACSKTPTSPASVTVVAFGDSLTSGTGVGSGRDYVSLLSNRTGVAIVNAGRSGDTTATALLRLDAAVLSRDPDIVIVFFGGNDLLQGVPVQRRTANITEIVERIRARGAEVMVVGLASGFLDPFDGALAGIAVGTSSTLVPAVLDGILGVPNLMSDLVHPNEAGHAVIADRIEPALRTVLRRVAG
jgi:acyl-CoA thioesterase-1